MPIQPYELILGLAVITVLGILAFRLKTMDRGGLISGIAIGILILAGGGWPWLILIMLFFTASAPSTHLKYEYKRSIGYGQEKGGVRGWRNTFANGGVAAIAAAAELWSGGDIYAAAFLGAVSAATSDTLATEIGLLSKIKPRLITDLRREVASGTSGGVTPLGELMTILGGLMIGVAAVLLGFSDAPPLKVVLAGVIGGFVGSTVDSALGATVQGIYLCEACGQDVENGIHHGRPTKHLRGVRLVDNNVVNFFATLFGALASLAVLYS